MLSELHEAPPPRRGFAGHEVWELAQDASALARGNGEDGEIGAVGLKLDARKVIEMADCKNAVQVVLVADRRGVLKAGAGVQAFPIDEDAFSGHSVLHGEAAHHIGLVEWAIAGAAGQDQSLGKTLAIEIA